MLKRHRARRARGDDVGGRGRAASRAASRARRRAGGSGHACIHALGEESCDRAREDVSRACGRERRGAERRSALAGGGHERVGALEEDMQPNCSTARPTASSRACPPAASTPSSPASSPARGVSTVAAPRSNGSSPWRPSAPTTAQLRLHQQPSHELPASLPVLLSPDRFRARACSSPRRRPPPARRLTFPGASSRARAATPPAPPRRRSPRPRGTRLPPPAALPR